VLGLVALAGLGWLVATDLSIAALDGTPTTGSWGLSLVLYGLGLAFVACFAWIGTRMLLAAPACLEG
jgi:hypothetical protein